MSEQRRSLRDRWVGNGPDRWVGNDRLPLAVAPAGADAACAFCQMPGVRRCDLHDPFGNRFELIDAAG